MYKPRTKWTISFLGLAMIQNTTVLGLESYVFTTFQSEPRSSKNAFVIGTVIPTFLSFYIFAFVYQLSLAYDALQRQNTIQVIGIIVMNLGLLVYGAVQLVSMQSGADELRGSDSPEVQLWSLVRPLMIAVPCVLSVGTVAMAFVAYKLYKEFAWMIYQHIDVDLVMRRRYLNYQIYITLLKFGFFYYLAFTIQFVVVDTGQTNLEFILTIIVIPATLVTLFMASYCMRQESKSGMTTVVTLFIASLAYFAFKTVRLYQPEYETPYIPARTELTAFAGITIILMITTIVYASLCVSAFDRGLKPFVNKDPLKNIDEANDVGVMGASLPNHGSGVVTSVEMSTNLGVSTSRPGSRS